MINILGKMVDEETLLKNKNKQIWEILIIIII
jgi:hypothetical protein